jgi:hypothetical protein
MRYLTRVGTPLLVLVLLITGLTVGRAAIEIVSGNEPAVEALDESSHISYFQCYRSYSRQSGGDHGWSHCNRSGAYHRVVMICGSSPTSNTNVRWYYGPWSSTGGGTSHKWCPYQRPFIKAVHIGFSV